MDANFWHQVWDENNIGFHQEVPNPLMVRHFDALNLPENARIFVPLCGKSLDMAWLLSKGCRVVGAELSEMAVKAFFKGAGVDPHVTQTGPFKLCSHGAIDIFVGDIFELNKARLGEVDAVYDRAALVALPPEMRARYTKHLVAITSHAPQLMICFEYEQTIMDGPPFSISDDAVRGYYQTHFSLANLERANVEGGLKGKCPASENVWLLSAS